VLRGVIAPAGARTVRCRTKGGGGDGGDHFVSTNAGCEGQIVDAMLGHVWP